MTPLTIESGKTVTLPKNTFTRPGYIFVGWNFKSDGTSNSFKDGQDITPSRSHTFYAQWKEVVTITFDANGGTGSMTPLTIETGKTVTLPKNTFTRPGYTFVGWNFKSDGTSNSFKDGQEITPSRSHTFYAQWKEEAKVEVVTITFDANGGTGSMTPLTIESGKSITLPKNTFTRPGYIFIGWNFKSDGTSNSFNDGQEITPSKDHTFYAQWKEEAKAEVVTITFNANGGKGTMPPVTYTSGEAKALPKNKFTRKNYTFISWNTKKDGSGKSYSNGKIIKPTKNNTFYAQWKKNKNSNQSQKITIKYYAGNGKTTGEMKDQECLINKNCTLSNNNFNKKGYVFKEWNTKADGTGTTYKNKAKIKTKDNLKLYAQWKKVKSKNEYEVIYDCNCKTSCKGTVNSQTLKKEDLFVPRVNSYVCDGYEFAGWKDGSGKNWTYKVEYVKNIEWGNLKDNTKKLYAKWTKISTEINEPIKPNSSEYEYLGKCNTLLGNITIEKGNFSEKKKISGKTVDHLLELKKDNSKKGVYCDFESDTLKYYVVQEKSNYMITYVWVKDAYKQFEMGLKLNGNKIEGTYGEHIMENEITKKSLQSKGLVGVNAAPMFQASKGFAVEKGFGSNGKLDGQPSLNLVRINGTTLIDYVEKNGYKRDDVILYGLTKNGNLKYFRTKFDVEGKDRDNECITDKCFKGHKLVRDYIESDNYNIKNVFGWYPVLINKGEISSSVNENRDANTTKSIRQGICQFDTNNYAFVTSTTHDFSKDTRKSIGLSRQDVAKIMKKMKCKTGFNLDGGGSVSYFYKSNGDDLMGPLDTHDKSRLSGGVIYFVEQ